MNQDETKISPRPSSQHRNTAHNLNLYKLDYEHLTSADKSNKNKEPWAINSAVECYLHTVEVTGSNPVSPTTIHSTPTHHP
jgi:hypothetical protein